MTTERNYHLSQIRIFDEAIKERKKELKKVHEPENVPDGEMYK